MESPKIIGFVFIETFADWEFGFLAASAVEWFGARAVTLTPEGKPVQSIAGFRLEGERALKPEENRDLDAVAVIGSDNWMSPTAPDVSALLGSVHERGVVGGICAGTLALARAGLFENRRHTSNGRDWINQNAPDYAGADLYQDVPHAVGDRKIVTAPGSAAGSFAASFLEALYPERAETIAEMRVLFAREYNAA